MTFFSFSFTPTPTIVPSAFLYTSIANPTTDTIGASIGAPNGGFAFTLNCIGVNHTPTRSGFLTIVLNASVFYRGAFVAPFTGSAGTYAALRLFVEGPGGPFQSRKVIFDASGPVGFYFPAADFESHSVALFVPVTSGSNIRIWADAIQYVFASGPGCVGVSNVLMTVRRPIII